MIVSVFVVVYCSPQRRLPAIYTPAVCGPLRGLFVLRPRPAVSGTMRSLALAACRRETRRPVTFRGMRHGIFSFHMRAIDGGQGAPRRPPLLGSLVNIGVCVYRSKVRLVAFYVKAAPRVSSTSLHLLLLLGGSAF